MNLEGYNDDDSKPPPSNLAERDAIKAGLADENYIPLSWDFAKKVIRSGKLYKFSRIPSEQEAYAKWRTRTTEEWGTITNYMLKARICWAPKDSEKTPHIVPKNPIAFVERSDYRILVNDWPYGWASGIRHVCVWLKNRLPVESQQGLLTPEGTAMVQNFVLNHFERRLGVEGQDQVLWYKNPSLLQSVGSIEHIHVLFRDIDDDAIGLETIIPVGNKVALKS